MEYRKHTSLKDLAQALGVSIPTVSRALKDSPEISSELCAKAKKLAKEMNYRPNPFAMSLRKNTPRIIGVVVPDIVTHFFASILNGIENMAVDNGYFIIITTSHESYEYEKRNIENLVNMRVEGIIACLSQETTDYTHLAALKDINMPLILFDRVCLTNQFSSVVADGVQSAQMATQHLLDTGSKRVAFIGGANHLDIVTRRKHGYLEALRDNRIPIEKEAAFSLNVLAQVRAEGIRAEIFPDSSKMKKQMGYANAKNIPFVALVGENEMNENKVTLKNMETGEQTLVSAEELIQTLKK